MYFCVWFKEGYACKSYFERFFFLKKWNSVVVPLSYVIGTFIKILANTRETTSAVYTCEPRARSRESPSSVWPVRRIGHCGDREGNAVSQIFDNSSFSFIQCFQSGQQRETVAGTIGKYPEGALRVTRLPLLGPIIYTVWNARFCPNLIIFGDFTSESARVNNIRDNLYRARYSGIDKMK